jgi:hypothetical protein
MASAADHFQQLESDARVLKELSEQYPAISPQSQALRRAGLALIYVAMNQRGAFAAFLQEMQSDLSDGQRAELRDRYGLDP